MLKSIDILVGLIVVMLVASMAVTVLTEFTTNLFNNKGRNLRNGLADMLRQLSASFDRATARRISATLLTHPLICETFGRLGSVVHREELIKLLMELAGGAGPHKLDEAPRKYLKTFSRRTESPIPKRRSTAFVREPCNSKRRTRIWRLTRAKAWLFCMWRRAISFRRSIPGSMARSTALPRVSPSPLAG